MRYKYKQWAVDYLKDHPDIVKENIDVEDPFFANDKKAIEIGSGKGEFIINLAKKNLNTSYAAVEIIPSIAGMMAKKIEEENITNVFVYPCDVENLFRAIPDGFFDKIYLNFSDPWPKKRHAKRRLTHIRFLNEYFRILKNGGEVIFKTDNTALYEFSMEEFKKTKFQDISFIDEYIFDEGNDVMSEYEKKFRDLGNNIHRIIAKKG